MAINHRTEAGTVKNRQVKIPHVCEERGCGGKRNIAPVVMQRKGGCKCNRCGRTMQPTEEGWKRLASMS